MSGQASIRGYLYQSLIAVLKSLHNNWSSICVEPNTPSDKVDIVWTYNDSSIEVSQVKSSINNFGKNDIFKWLHNLTLDYDEANIYSIYLVGNSSQSTKAFFNSIENKPKSAFPEQFKTLFGIKDKLQIFFEPNNIDTLEDALVGSIDKFLSSKEILTNYSTKKLIAGGMVNQIIKISTSGRVMYKSEFEAHLLDWLLYNYSEQVSLNKAKFELQFYHNNQFTKKISDVKIADIQKSNLFITKKKKVRELFELISKYNFETKTFEESFEPSDLNTIQTSRNSFEYNNQPVIINDWEIRSITKSLKEILNVEPKKEFFNFGELRETKTLGVAFPLSQDKLTLNGSEEEKEKRQLYTHFNWQIADMVDLVDFWEKISKLSVLPIVITNTGKKHNEDIKVQLFIPKDVKVINPNNFPIPKMVQNLKDLNSDDSFLFQNIKHKQNSIVNEFYSDYLMPPSINLGMFSYEQKNIEEKKFRSLLDYYFDYNYYYDKPEYTIIECNIKELNTNEVLAFPTYLFVISKNDFTIDYKVTCKNEPEKITGALKYKS